MVEYGEYDSNMVQIWFKYDQIYILRENPTTFEGKPHHTLELGAIILFGKIPFRDNGPRPRNLLERESSTVE